jgi:allantoinase
MADLAIHSKRVLLDDGQKDATVLISEGMIEDVIPGLPENLPCKLIDVHNSLLMPGVVDPHVHINEPGRTEWEGFDTATKAAIAGGLTTLVDMPLNSSPVTTSAKAFEEKMQATKNKLHCHCGFWGGVVPGNEKEIEPLIKKGVLGFKAFLTHSGIDEFPNVTEEDLRKAMPLIAKYDLPLLVHCELTGNERPLENDRKSYTNYLHSRPKKWEDDAIALMIRLCEEFNCRTHIVHLSSANSIAAIKKAKEKGLPLTVETAQHYLYFNAEEIKPGQTQFKCAPPIREKANNDLLWQALREGIIDFVATDHSPATPELKEMDSGDFGKAWGGISSLQFALPVLWTAARERGFSPADVCRWLCTNPAKFIGREKKGRIVKGADADLVIWNDEKKFTVIESGILHKNKITPYLGKELYGVVEQTFLGGVNVFEKGTMTLNKGHVLFNREVENKLARAGS